MKVSEKFENFEYQGTDWRRLMVRGSLMLCMGAFLVSAALLKPDVGRSRYRGEKPSRLIDNKM